MGICSIALDKGLCLFVPIRDTRKSFSIILLAAKIKSRKDVDGPPVATAKGA